MTTNKIFSSVFSCFKNIRYFLFRFRIYLSGKYPFQIIKFENIEAKYLRSCTNERDLQWRTILENKGNLYQHLFDTHECKETIKLLQEPKRNIFLANNANICGKEGVIYHKNFNAIVLESLEDYRFGTSYYTNFSSTRYRNTEIIKGLSLSICSVLSEENYAHFLFDAISKLYLAKDILPKVDSILISGSEKPFQKKIFNHLNISQKLIWLESKSNFECEQLLFTSRLNSTTHACPWVVEAIRNIFTIEQENNRTNKEGKIIFASRKSSTKRKTILEDKVLAELPNVEIVDFSNLSIAETIEVCQNCRIFIGFHGAAFTNLAFCSPKIKVVELHFEKSPVVSKYYFYSIAKYLNMEYEIITLSESMSTFEIKSVINQTIDK